MADWVSIKAEYISTGISTRSLAEKSGVSYASLRRRAEKEHWADERKTTERKVSAKVAQKVALVKVAHEADRITRLLGVGDILTDKLEQSAKQLGTYTVVKRKSERYEIGENDKPIGITETEEVAVPADAVINTADAKRIASALKDLSDIASRPASDEQSITKVAELMGRLDKEAEDGISDTETAGVPT